MFPRSHARRNEHELEPVQLVQSTVLVLEKLVIPGKRIRLRGNRAVGVVCGGGGGGAATNGRVGCDFWGGAWFSGKHLDDF